MDSLKEDVQVKTILRNTKPTANQLYFDPRTKLLLCLTVSTVMLAMKKTGIFAYIMPAMVILPLVFLIIIKKTFSFSLLWRNVSFCSHCA